MIPGRSQWGRYNLPRSISDVPLIDLQGFSLWLQLSSQQAQVHGLEPAPFQTTIAGNPATRCVWCCDAAGSMWAQLNLTPGRYHNSGENQALTIARRGG